MTGDSLRDTAKGIFFRMQYTRRSVQLSRKVPEKWDPGRQKMIFILCYLSPKYTAVKFRDSPDLFSM